MSINQDEEYRCYVSNLVPQTTTTSLRLAFEKYWPVIDAVVMRDRDGVSRGFGFVTLESAEHMEQAISLMNGKKIHRSAIMVSRAFRRRSDDRGNAAGGERWRIREEGEHPGNEDGIASGQVCSHCGDPGHTISQCSAIYDSRTWPRYSVDTYNPTLWPPLYGTYGSSSQPPPPPPPPPPPAPGLGYGAYGSSSQTLLPQPPLLPHGYVAYGSSSQPLLPLPLPPHGHVAYGSGSQPLLPLPPPPHGHVAYGSSSQPLLPLPPPPHGHVAYGSGSQPLLPLPPPPPGYVAYGSSSQPLLQQQQPPPGTYGPDSVPSMQQQEPQSERHPQ